MPQQQAYKNLALCYHGLVDNPNDKSAYRSYTEDFKEQIIYIKQLGYTFVKPTKYYEWYIGQYTPQTPICTIIFDDALESIKLVSPWLIDNNIPFGIAVIGRRLRKHLPEQDFLSWNDLKTIVDSGLCEISSHSYNFHHTCVKVEGNEQISAAILEGPCYKDNGEFIYTSDGDNLWYWDFKHIDNISWAFPIIGTDTATGTPITSTVNFKAKSNVIANKMRLWACLHKPFGSGYSAGVQIYINNVLVSNKTITPKNYDNNIIQWPEKEFITIPFDTPYQIELGKSYEIKFVTQTTGNAALRVYSVPDFSGDFYLTSTCTNETFLSTEIWPAKACIILADSNGNSVTDGIFNDYVYKDLEQNNNVVTKYLNANWITNSTSFLDEDPLECLVLGGTYSNGSKANTEILFHAQTSFTGETLRFKYASYLGNRYPLIIDVYINERKVAQLEPSWNNWKWQEIDIEPYEFSANQDYNIRFETKNLNSSGLGLVRIYMDQPNLPRVIWDDENGTWIPPSPSEFNAEKLYEVSNLEGTDVYPDGINIDGSNYSWIYNTPYDGPGKAFVEILSCNNEAITTPTTQICYPFSSYYSTMVANIEDLHPALKTAASQLGMNSGFTVWDGTLNDYRNAQQNYSKYLIPRYSVPGNVAQATILNNIRTIIQ